ncbi:MAG: hypothetical protein NW201_01455 [Gemmatimonadales bacterium]|nr:hypothetical protein [Gemmatimonadales bacterium]
MSELKPIAPTRLAEELKRLHEMRKAGDLDVETYDQRFAKMVGELRDRRIAGTRDEILAAIAPLKAMVPPQNWDLLLNRLDLE